MMSLSQALNPSDTQSKRAHMDDDISSQLIVANAVCALLACAAVALRFWSRKLAGTYIGLDDYLAVLSLV